MRFEGYEVGSKLNGAELPPEIAIFEPADEASGPQWLAKYSRVISALLLCNCLIVTSLTAVGWVFGASVMYEMAPGFATMKFNTALSFLILCIAGGSYLLYGKFAARIVLTAVGFVALIALTTLVESAFSTNIGIDQLFVQDPLTPTGQFPGRMSQATAIGLLLSSVSLMCLYFHLLKLAQVLASLVTLTGLLALTAYVFDRSAIENFSPFSSMSINTAIAATSLGLALLLAESEKAYLRFLNYESSGGLLAQRFAPYALLIPFATAGFVMLSESLFGFDDHFGLFLLSTLIAFLFMVLLSRMSKFVHTLELEGHRAEIRERMTSERIAQLQRIHSMGLVAGGLAHDFKNLLMPIVWSADLGINTPEQDAENAKRFRIIRDSANKASALAERMMDLGKQKPLEFKHVNLNKILQENQNILRGMSKGSIDVVYNLAEHLDDIVADKAQIEQVLINLTRNACQAMSDVGKLEISTSQCSFDRKEMRSLSSANIENGEYVCLTVSDEGVGMTEEQRLHVLEPFYTTREVGLGHGLGLSSVNDIVLQHLGILDIVSEPGKGTSVLVYFPVRVRTKVQSSIKGKQLANIELDPLANATTQWLGNSVRSDS